MPDFPRADLDAIRRRTPLSALIGRQVKLRKAGQDWMGLCPFHTEKTPSFSVSDRRGTYHCYGCQAHGSVFDWVMFAEGVTFAEAVTRLAEGGVIQRALPGPTARTPERVSDVVESTIVADWLWRSSRPAVGSIVEHYLVSRGLRPEGVPGALNALRFHPRAAVLPWRNGGQEGDSALLAPAMLGAIRDATGVIIGVHATYLARNGSGKAALPQTRTGKARPTRKMWGRLTGGAVWLAGSPSGSRDVPLVTGEGIETVWSFVQELGRPCRAAASLSLDNLQGSPLLTPVGALPIWKVQPDPGRASFVVADAGDVVVLVDADMKPLRDRKVQEARGARWHLRTLSGADRAQLCASLAVQNWRRAGARRVEAVRPPIGWDFNDTVRAA